MPRALATDLCLLSLASFRPRPERDQCSYVLNRIQGLATEGNGHFDIDPETPPPSIREVDLRNLEAEEKASVTEVLDGPELNPKLRNELPTSLAAAMRLDVLCMLLHAYVVL